MVFWAILFFLVFYRLFPGFGGFLLLFLRVWLRCDPLLVQALQLMSCSHLSTVLVASKKCLNPPRNTTCTRTGVLSTHKNHSKRHLQSSNMLLDAAITCHSSGGFPFSGGLRFRQGLQAATADGQVLAMRTNDRSGKWRWSSSAKTTVIMGFSLWETPGTLILRVLV